jgi:K+-transporting ATPase A subunit
MTDAIANKAALAVIADLASNGGGTYGNSTLLPFKPPAGYAVGIGGLVMPAECATPSMVLWAFRQVSREHPTASFIGTWLDNGVVYIDAVEYFATTRRPSAMLRGMECGQKAIFDFAAGEAITLPEEGA